MEEQGTALGEEDEQVEEQGGEETVALPDGEGEGTLTSIEGDGATGEAAEEASNTIATDESPDVISSYTEGAAGTDEQQGAEEEEQSEATQAVEEGDEPPAQQDQQSGDGEEVEPAGAPEEATREETPEGAAAEALEGEPEEAPEGQPETADAGTEAEAEAGAGTGDEAATADAEAGTGPENAEDQDQEPAADEAPTGSRGEPESSSPFQSRSPTPDTAAQQQEAESTPPRGSSAASAGAAAAPAEASLTYETVPSGRTAAEQAAPARVNDYNQAGIRAIDVEINQGPGLPYKMVQVLLDYTQQQQKSYLGGFKNKRSGVVYHHAWTQTPKAPKYQGVERKLERQTQTVKVAQRSGQTVREAATQMERPGVIIDTSEDRLRTPGPYQTSEQRLEIVTRATCAIQRFWRGYQGRKRAEYLRQKKQEREAFLREQELKAKQEAEEHRRKEIERRMHPQTASDFEILYNELEAWRLQETRKIKQAGLQPEKEQEVLQQLLHKETKLLQTIDRLKINANHENKEIRIQNTLTAMGKPKKFDLKNGKTVEVHTPFTTRAMELMQLYNGLNLPMLTIDERLDVLLHVKWTVKEFDCNLTREIVELIDREADLLNRGRNPKVLEGLRKRISSLFLTFVETPEFNPESARFQIVPMEFETYLFEKLGKASSRAEGLVGATTGKWDL